MRVYIGSDHAGFDMRCELIKYLREKGYEVIECMHQNLNMDDNTKDAADEVADKVLNDNTSYGILICGTGIGMSMAANRHSNIRAALCHSEYDAELSRYHNNANILCLGGRTMGLELAKNIVNKFLNTEFSNIERYVRRNEELK